MKVTLLYVYYEGYNILCCAKACFEWKLHTQISGGDSILRTTFCVDHVVDTTFLFHDTLGHHNR